MKATTAAKIVAKAGRDITVARANSWIGSKDSCFRSGVDASKKWACSVSDPHFKAIVEPTNHYDTLDELVQYQLDKAGYFLNKNGEVEKQ